MEKTIAEILRKQISNQTRLPTYNDISPFSAMFESDETGRFTYKMGKDACEPRVQILASIMSGIKIPNTKFIFLTHDYADPAHYQNTTNFSLCLGKLTNQEFITIPNIHLLNGLVEFYFKQVQTSDVEFEKKYYSSIFVGGPNCDLNGNRFKYAHATSGLNSSEHMCIITNHQIFPIQQQLKRLFLINIDGHSLCYDRLYWQMASNSVPVYIARNNGIVQLHDLLIKPNVHYIESTSENWIKIFNELRGEQEYLKKIAENGKNFTETYFKQDSVDESIKIIDFCIREISRKQSIMQ